MAMGTICMCVWNRCECNSSKTTFWWNLTTMFVLMPNCARLQEFAVTCSFQQYDPCVKVPGKGICIILWHALVKPVYLGKLTSVIWLYDYINQTYKLSNQHPPLCVGTTPWCRRPSPTSTQACTTLSWCAPSPRSSVWWSCWSTRCPLT